MLECIRQRESVCVCVSWNGVEGWRMRELESEYEITRRRYSSLLVVTRRRYSLLLVFVTRHYSLSLLVVVITHCRHYIIQCNTYLYSIIHSI